ncbi:hypothetical protein ACFY1L_23815 [Streptomyces sp. NPDC001663]|uniref:hypothetical protein n=1 Tax=Streptomyces sp. NPDC001663 TaxID=3364597 RepID=UPI00368AB115
MNQGSAVLRRNRRRQAAAVVAAATLSAGFGLAGMPSAAAVGSAASADGEACTPTAGFESCRLFVSTKAAQEFTVPGGVTKLDVRAWGQGGAGNSMVTGGAGAFAAGTVKVTPGETLTLKVGGAYGGDALGGAGGGGFAEAGGNSTGIRTSSGKALLIAAGGGGAGGDTVTAHAGSGGAENGQDASEKDLGGKGAKGDKGGAAGTGAEAGADQSAGGAGGDGVKASIGGGGGGAGYAGGGGGAGADKSAGPSTGVSGSGGGGSSHVDADRVSGARLVGSDSYKAPEKTDPFWAPAGDPVNSGVAEGGVNAPGGDGRVVIQWDAPAVADLTQVAGSDQTVAPLYEFVPMAVAVKDKDGNPIEDVSVTFTIDDPDKLGVEFEKAYHQKQVVVATDAKGRAETPYISGSSKEGKFTVRAETEGASTVFTAQVKKTGYQVETAAGDGQQAGQGESFEDALQALVTADGKPAAVKDVEFKVEDGDEDAPRFDGEDQTVHITTDSDGKATAPTLIAGQGKGTYTVTATSAGATATFTVEVVAADASASPSPSPSESSDGTGTSGDDSGTSTDGGILASTGAGGMGMLLAFAAGLGAVGVAAVRFAPRLRARFQRD